MRSYFYIIQSIFLLLLLTLVGCENPRLQLSQDTKVRISRTAEGKPLDDVIRTSFLQVMGRPMEENQLPKWKAFFADEDYTLVDMLINMGTSNEFLRMHLTDIPMAEGINVIYVRVLNRPPTPQETADGREVILNGGLWEDVVIQAVSKADFSTLDL